MVQLKANSISLGGFGACLFQFLDGTIKSGLFVLNNESPYQFQFLDGTIKRNTTTHNPQPPWPFQFLDGTIKSCQLR